MKNIRISEVKKFTALDPKYAKLWEHKKQSFFDRVAVIENFISFLFYGKPFKMKNIIMSWHQDTRNPKIHWFDSQICKILKTTTKKKKKKKKKKMKFCDWTTFFEIFFYFLVSSLKWRMSSCLDIRIPEIQKITNMDAKYAKLWKQENLRFFFFDKAAVIENLNFFLFSGKPFKRRRRISSCFDIKIPKIKKK